MKISHTELQENLRSFFFYDYTGQSHNLPHPGRIACCSARNSWPPATKALQTICGYNTNIVSSSWWWEYKCPKHVEQIICAKYSVASSWFSSLHLYYDARRNIYQIHSEVRLCPCAKKISQSGQTMSQLTICTRSSLLQNLRELIYDGKMYFARCSTLPACQVDQCWTR